MTGNDVRPAGQASDLREPAEDQVTRTPAEGAASASAVEDLLHELRVHQVELEMQNEELRRMQLALEESRDRYVDLYEFAPVGYLTLNPQALITEANLTVAALLGEDRKKLVQRRFASFVTPEDRGQWGQRFASMMRNSKRQTCDLAFQRTDGTRLYARLDCLRVMKAGDQSSLRVALTDITEFKRLEAEHREVQATMAHRGRLLLAGELASGLAHELNQPLTAIINYSEASLHMLRNSNAEREDLINFLEKIATQGERAGDIIRQMRSFTRKTTMQKEPTDINQLINAARELMDSDARVRGVRLHVDADDQLPPVLADPLQIQQVLDNLLRNSLEALRNTPAENREVVITVRPTQDAEMMVSVRDTGPGLSDKMHEQLFYPFVTSKDDGVGLGLSISHSIIEAHGGRLWAGEPGSGGAVFNFTIPLARLHRD